MDAIERIEVSIRTQWAFHMAHQYDAHAHLNEDLFQDRKKYNHSIDTLEKEYRRSRETFIDHYRKTYDEPDMPPWYSLYICDEGRGRWFKGGRAN